MIQFNLLPDVKLDYIKAQRTRRLALSIAFLASTAAVALLLLLIGFGQLQKHQSQSLSDQISKNRNTLEKEPQIDKVLTVQNQLTSLTSLHDGKPAASRLFDYLNQVTPAEVDITSFDLDTVAHTASINGTADSLGSVNKYVDTLKFTKFFETSDSKTQTQAFTDVVLSSYSVNAGQASSSSSAAKGANYTITLSYDPTLFDITKDVKITVPSGTTTRSEVDKPADLFTGTPTNKTESTR